MSEEQKTVHICPILGRTVLWIDEKCMEECGKEDCPVKEKMAEMN